MIYMMYQVLKQLTDGAKELAKKYNAIGTKNRTRCRKVMIKHLEDIVINLGYKIKDDAKDFKDEIQPRLCF